MLKVKVEDPNALRFILQDDVYLLDQDKLDYSQTMAPVPPVETPQVIFNYLGSNKKNLLVLVNYPAQEFMPGDHLTALESVLARKGYSLEDVAIVNIAKSDTVHEQLIAYFKPGKLVILGQESIPIGMQPPKFNRRETSGGYAVLCTFSFDAMMGSTDNKKAFWDEMKTL